MQVLLNYYLNYVLLLNYHHKVSANIPVFQVRGEGRGGFDAGVRHRHRPRGGRVLQGRRAGRQLLRPPLLTRSQGTRSLQDLDRKRFEKTLKVAKDTVRHVQIL